MKMVNWRGSPEGQPRAGRCEGIRADLAVGDTLGFVGGDSLKWVIPWRVEMRVTIVCDNLLCCLTTSEPFVTMQFKRFNCF